MLDDQAPVGLEENPVLEEQVPAGLEKSLLVEAIVEQPQTSPLLGLGTGSTFVQPLNFNTLVGSIDRLNPPLQLIASSLQNVVAALQALPAAIAAGR